MKQLLRTPILVLFLVLFLVGSAWAQGGGCPQPSRRAALGQRPAGGSEPGTANIPAADWTTEWVDKEKLFRQMEDRSLALDSSGHPHIAYGEEGVFYAWHDGSAWHLETADSSPGVGRFATLGLDAFDHPHIAYYDEIAEDLKYAHHDGSAWHTEVVDPGIGNC